MEYVLLVIIILVLIIFLYRRKKGGGVRSSVRSLRDEYRRKAGLPPATADEHIDNYISRLRQKHPNRSEEWYLEKMLFDLEKDRR